MIDDQLTFFLFVWPQVQLWCSALFSIRNSRLFLSQHDTQLPVQTRVLYHNLQALPSQGRPSLPWKSSQGHSSSESTCASSHLPLC